MSGHATCCAPWIEKLKDGCGVPRHLRAGLVLYLAHRIEPGGFLCRVLENDLVGALARADLDSREGLFDLVSWLYNHAPAPCWGSEVKVEEWLNAEPAEAVES